MITPRGIALLAEVVGILSCPSPAEAESGPYIAVRGGLAQARAFKADVGAVGAVRDALQEQYQLGYEVDLAAGYQHGPVRIELEASQKRTNLDTLFTVPGVGVPNNPVVLARVGAGLFIAPTGKLRVRSAMANLYVSSSLGDLLADGKVQLFIGAGGGHAWVRAFDHRALSGARTFLDGGAKSLAWQLMAGTRYDLTRRMALEAGYKHFSVPNLRFTDTLKRQIAGTSKWSGFLVGVSYRF